MDGGGGRLWRRAQWLAGWAGLLCAPTLLASQRLNPPPPPSPAPAPALIGNDASAARPPQKNTEAKLPAQESMVPVLPQAPSPPAPDPIIAGHDLEVGIFYFHRGDWVGALDRFEDAIYNDPHDPEAFCRAGDSEDKLKHAVRARADWQRCQNTAGEGKWAQYARKALARHPAPPT